uniref:Uncharacterized protein n=1 Tax=Panagrellus redivivus TaxID=6233 RepID=A0A7E4UMZ3_PANRE
MSCTEEVKEEGIGLFRRKKFQQVSQNKLFIEIEGGHGPKRTQSSSPSTPGIVITKIQWLSVDAAGRGGRAKHFGRKGLAEDEEVDDNNFVGRRHVHATKLFASVHEL